MTAQGHTNTLSLPVLGQDQFSPDVRVESNSNKSARVDITRARNTPPGTPTPPTAPADPVPAAPEQPVEGAAESSRQYAQDEERECLALPADPKPRVHPALRRVGYVLGFEALGILFTTLILSSGLGHGGGQSTLTAVLVSSVATVWNYAWNTLFERYETRRGSVGRGWGMRSLHAAGFEVGLLVLTIPLVALVLGVGLGEAFLIEAGLLLFFLVFTFVYSWAFDRIFGLPASVRNN